MARAARGWLDDARPSERIADIGSCFATRAADPTIETAPTGRRQNKAHQ